MSKRNVLVFRAEQKDGADASSSLRSWEGADHTRRFAYQSMDCVILYRWIKLSLEFNSVRY